MVDCCIRDAFIIVKSSRPPSPPSLCTSDALRLGKGAVPAEEGGRIRVCVCYEGGRGGGARGNKVTTEASARAEVCWGGGRTPGAAGRAAVHRAHCSIA
jgi:hypothetical protein